MPPVRTQAEFEAQEQRTKLAESYQSLLNEFSANDLQTVGNYSIGRLIGKGSFGKVYLASHKLTNGSKVVLKSAKKDDGNLAREIHHHRQFLHPHIARLYEVVVTEALVWLVLEYCPGDELYNHLLNHGRMEPAKVQKIFTQLVGAVSYVHGKSCVHRDLKLENILLDKHENVKLVDFGFTREYQGTTSYLQTWCGTVCYSAPEMLKGERYAGEKVDVWSLGIILYALLCGELPWDEDDEMATKMKILQEDPHYPEYLPEQAMALLKRLLSKRPLLRPALGDILKDPWLAEHAPQQQEILKVQQPAPFTTQLEKDVLQRMRSAGVDIDLVIEHVLSQRCDSLAGWWALLLEKEQRKEKRRDRKRKDREAEAKALRRLSAASGRLLAAQSNLGEIHESEEHAISEPSRKRGRPLSRANGSVLLAPDLPKVTEATSSVTDSEDPPVSGDLKDRADSSRSRSRPPPPPKDVLMSVGRRARATSRSSQSMLRNMTTNPELLSPSYVPAPQRRRRTFYAQPLKEQLAWVKHFFKEGALKRGKSPTENGNARHTPSPKQMPLSREEPERVTIARTSTGPPLQLRRKSVGGSGRPEIMTRNTMPARPRINTTSSTGSATSIRAKRTSLSPHTLTPHSSYRRSSAGLRGRKSTSSSVSSIRSAYQGHQHTHSKASSASSASVASPSGPSSTSGSRMARSPHSSVKLLPQTPTNSGLPSGIRVSRRPPPANIGALPGFGEARSAFGGGAPASPGLPVFARRKRSVFKGPMSSSPSGAGRSSGHGNGRSTSVQGRPSGEMMPGVVEEEDEEEVEDEEEAYEDVDQFGGVLAPVGEPTDEELVTPLSPPAEHGMAANVRDVSKMPLTAEALAMMEEEEEKKELAAEEAEERGGRPSPAVVHELE